jgi:hypothetical protein
VALTLSAPSLVTVEAQAPFVTPLVFQAAGPTIASIQSTVDAYRAALGAANNGNTPGPLAGGRREINWDGGGSTATSIVPTPFDGFLVSRGAQFITNGTGFVQAPATGLAATFGNSNFATIFQAFSPVRLFAAIGSNVTDVRFFVPGGGNIPATTTGFGAVFTDVDREEGTTEPDFYSGKKLGATLDYYDHEGSLLFSSFVPATPGRATLSFFGIVFADARIAGVRIRSGNRAPGPPSPSADAVVMDDFIYGEPQAWVQ